MITPTPGDTLPSSDMGINLAYGAQKEKQAKHHTHETKEINLKKISRIFYKYFFSNFVHFLK